MSSSIEQQFATSVLRGVGTPVTQRSVHNMLGWMAAEGGHTHNDARFNFLNTTQPEPGAGNTGSQGNIKVYRNLGQGVQATIQTLRNGRYGDILGSFNAAAPQFVHAVNSSPWGTKSDFTSLIGGAQTSGPLGPGGIGGGMIQPPAAPSIPTRGPVASKMALLAAVHGLHTPGADRIGLLTQLMEMQGAGQAQQQPMTTPAGATPHDQQVQMLAGPLGQYGMPGTSRKVIGTPYAGTHTLGNWESDNAIDLAMPVGSPLYAVEGGVIGPQFGSLGSGGRFAGLRLHLNGPQTQWYYAHLSRFAPGLKPGTHVQKGQLIGYSGSANGVGHLHLGVNHGDPRQYLGLK